MAKGDGMSFAEFTYPLLQAWDWWHMYNALGIRMQIGGSDQFGNITAGMDAVRYIAKTHPSQEMPKKTEDDPFGFTTPLLTSSSGTKLGKSSGNAIWLEKDMTSCFDLYAHFLKTSDEDVSRYLKLFTFMPIPDIDALVAKHMENPSLRLAQHKLASEFLELVHGPEEAKITAQQHKLMHQKPSLVLGTAETPNDPVGVSALGLPQVTLNNRPRAHLKLPRTLIETKSIGKILFACGLAGSASEGHRLAANQALFIGGGAAGKHETMHDGHINWVRIKLWKPEDTKKFLIDDNLLLVRRGKSNIRIIEVVEDDVYEASMARYPGDGKDYLYRAPREDGTYPETTGASGSGSEAGASDVAKRPVFGIPSKGRKLENYSPTWANVEADLEEDERSARRDRRQSSRNLYAGQDEEAEGITPEARLEILRNKLEYSMKAYHEKKDAKYAPKGRFKQHGHARGPVPR